MWIQKNCDLLHLLVIVSIFFFFFFSFFLLFLLLTLPDFDKFEKNENLLKPLILGHSVYCNYLSVFCFSVLCILSFLPSRPGIAAGRVKTGIILDRYQPLRILLSFYFIIHSSSVSDFKSVIVQISRGRGGATPFFYMLRGALPPCPPCVRLCLK